MDYLLLEILGEDFAKKYGADPRKNVRARLRMLDVIEKQRKILSANLEATVHLEALMNDEDLHRNIKRTEFEELIAPMIEKFSLVCKEALAKSGKYNNQGYKQTRVEGTLFNGCSPSYICKSKFIISSL